MKKGKQRHIKNQTAYIIVIFAMAIALFFCFSMISNINQRMNESATSNLRNTTRVIEGNIESYILKDLESLSVVGEVYRTGDSLERKEVAALCEVMGFEGIGIVDAQGNSVGEFFDIFQPSDLHYFDEWVPEVTGFSDAYFGDSGRLQITLWTPFYDGNEYAGTVFGDVILSKYYSADVFTFYEGAGRTYLFDSSNGKWILRSLGADGLLKREEDIFSLLLSSGNTQKDVEAFRDAVNAQKTGTARLEFNGESSYVGFMPLSCSSDWYVATVIAKDVLLKESAQVQRMIGVIFVTLCLTLIFFAVIFAVWQVRTTKIKEANYREALFANVSSNIDSAFLIYEKAGRRTAFVSDNVKRLLGLERRWLQDNAAHLFDWCNIDKKDEQRSAFLNGTLEAPSVREVCVEDEMGSKSRYIRLELIPADRGQEIAVLTDITADKEIQQSLLDAMQRAENASQAKNDFLSAMSHDIRTPMNGVMGMTAIAAAHLDDKNRVKDCLKKINEASVHLLNLINEVLDMSRIESGKMELCEEPFNLAELVQNVLSMNYPGIRQKNHTIKVRIHSMKHEQVIGDSIRLQRIVANLISNAIKYTPDGGLITLEIQEKPEMIKGYGCYELVVRDNGIGMTEEFQQRLFEPFEREEDVRISKIQGTGLGMSIVKNIVNLMMGDIQVESEKHKGSTFRVRINLRLDEEQEEAGESLRDLSVLVVDDDAITCETIVNMLHDIGMVAEWEESGERAVVNVVEKHQAGRDYLAVILDWKMPGMDGIATARRIREEVGEDVPIIILTAYDWSDIEEEAREAGVDEFLAKPVYKSKLRQKMLNLASDGRDSQEIIRTMSKAEMLSGKTVLLAEDNLLNMEIAVEFMHMAGLNVDSVEDGAAAVERFAASRPGTYDLIMMDIQMPKMNGYEATRAIRKMDRPDSKTVPIVAMTADAFVQDVQTARAAGMNEHISKPISAERLQEVLVQFLLY